ncbi:MAG: acyl--CoA ligase, partial [Acidobacteriota bacterium]|nr:acyl--CoA ligase [Acidobacteriota bacterium]
MVRRTLIDVFDDLALIHSDFIVQDDGYRSWTWTYAQVAGAAQSFAARLESAGIGADDKVVIWSENSAEWIAVLWGCVLRGVVAVPVDYRSPSDLVLRISDIVDARAIVVGETVPSPQATRPVWPIRSVAPRAAATAPRAPSSASVTADSVAEIIFTSGATAEPKGVVLTHKNILANIIPIEREIAKYRRYLRLVAPIRFLNLLPLSHMFGQSLAT